MATVTFQGKPLTLEGSLIKAGDKAPDFQAVDQALSPQTLKDFAGKIKVVTSFPSIDTPVCDLQVREFNKRATALSSDVVIIGISKDLPFAHKRFCQANGIDHVITLSDYQKTSFGMNYGLSIKELCLLARAVVVIGKDDVVKYVELVQEITQSPNYDAALQVVKNLAGK